VKIYIIGTSCSGKTTLGKLLAKKFNLNHIELDQLWWLPKWQHRQQTDFRQLVENKLAESTNWVVDGNYSHLRNLLVSKADHIIWLNLPFYLVFWRSIKRSVGRIISGETICNGNKENITALLSKDGMPAWVIRSYNERRAYGAYLQSTQENIIELRSRQDIKHFINTFSNPLQ
jgi:adenylate kinase family enzyme